MDKLEQRTLKAEALTRRVLGYVNRLSGSDDISVFINKMVEATQVADQLAVSLAALQALRMAAGDPLAWLTAGVAVTGLGISTVNLFEARRPQY